MSECPKSSYAESFYADSVSNLDDDREEFVIEKPRGQRRWLGKEHHRGKERLHNSVKDRTYIEKTVKSADPLSKRAADKIDESTKDELRLNVVYSMDKKNRWNDATTVTLLSSAPDDVNVEVVEKNALEQYGFMHPNKSTFAVHSRKVRKEDSPGEFEIRKATSTSSKGQDYSNFLPKSREFSKKANAKMMTLRNEEEEIVEQPTVTYNIYKTHHSKDVVGSELFKAKVVSKSGRHRANKMFDMEVYDDDEYFDDEEDDFEVSNTQSHARSILDLDDCVVDNIKKQVIRNKRNDSEISYEMLDYPESEYSHQFNIQGYLNQEGFTFMESDITFSNQTACFEEQINQIREEKDLKIKDLRPNQYLVDISKRCQLHGAKKDGETTTVMVFTHLKLKTFNVLLNSTIISHPEKRSDEYLKKLISSATSILEAITRVSGEMNQNRNMIDMITTSGKYYGEKDLAKLLNDSTVWDFQMQKMMKMNWPNQNYHSTWANSEELSQIGGKLEWNDLCEMVKKENRIRTCYTSAENCGECSRKKKSHELFLVENESKVKCTDCLRNQFNREFMSNRLPIDLETDTAEELEYFPTFIPLTLLNLYIRMVAETIYKDLGATGDFEKCPSCKSAVFFEETTADNEKKSQNRSCPCGYSWCKECKNVPHWPMNCSDFSEWEKKWLLRYSMMHAQGTGSEALLQITCSCGNSIINVLLPAGKFISCSNCKKNVNTETMHSIYEPYYWPYSPRQRERLRQYYRDHKNEDAYPYQPIAESRTEISKIPAIKQSVMEVCGAARDVRFDLKLRNQMVKREQVWIRKYAMETEIVENLFGTTAYLSENVTAWMHMSNQNDRNVKNTLETMMENRKNLIEVLEGGDQESIKKCIQTLRNQIDSVVSSVEKKLKEATPRH